MPVRPSATTRSVKVPPTSKPNWCIFDAAEVEPEPVSSCNSLALMARLIVEGRGVAVWPTALMKAEIDRGLIRVLPTKMPLASGDMVVAHSGPAHRYRLLNRMIIKALNESGLMEPL